MIQEESYDGVITLGSWMEIHQAQTIRFYVGEERRIGVELTPSPEQRIKAALEGDKWTRSIEAQCEYLEVGGLRVEKTGDAS